MRLNGWGKGEGVTLHLMESALVINFQTLCKYSSSQFNISISTMPRKCQTSISIPFTQACKQIQKNEGNKRKSPFIRHLLSSTERYLYCDSITLTYRGWREAFPRIQHHVMPSSLLNTCSHLLYTAADRTEHFSNWNIQERGEKYSVFSSWKYNGQGLKSHCGGVSMTRKPKTALSKTGRTP